MNYFWAKRTHPQHHIWDENCLSPKSHMFPWCPFQLLVLLLQSLLYSLLINFISCNSNQWPKQSIIFSVVWLNICFVYLKYSVKLLRENVFYSHCWLVFYCRTMSQLTLFTLRQAEARNLELLLKFPRGEPRHLGQHPLLFQVH